MKKIIAAVATITILSISGANAWQLDVNVGDVNVSAGDGYVDVWTPHGSGSGSWVRSGGAYPSKASARKKSHRTLKLKRRNTVSGAKLHKIKHRRLK